MSGDDTKNPDLEPSDNQKIDELNKSAEFKVEEKDKEGKLIDEAREKLKKLTDSAKSASALEKAIDDLCSNSKYKEILGFIQGDVATARGKVNELRTKESNQTLATDTVQEDQKEQTPEEKLLEDIKDLGDRTKALNSEIAELKKETGQDVAVLGQMLNDLKGRAPTPQDREIVEQIEQKQKEREEERRRLEERLKKLKEEREQKQADLEKFEEEHKDKKTVPERKQVLDLRIAQSKEALTTIHLDLMKGENDLKEIDDNLKGIGKLVNAVKAVFKKSEKEKEEKDQEAKKKERETEKESGRELESQLLDLGEPNQSRTDDRATQADINTSDTNSPDPLLNRLSDRFGEDYPKEVVAATGKMIGSFTDSPGGRPENTTAQAMGKTQETKKETQEPTKPPELKKPPNKGPKNPHDKGRGR